jgi:hypothetical protein
MFVLVSSVSTGSIWIDVVNSTLSRGALPKDSYIRADGCAIDILVAQNPHFHDNWQIRERLCRLWPPVIGFNNALG